MSVGYDVNCQVQIETEWALPLARIQQAVEWVLRAHHVAPETGISIVITGDDEVRCLNRQFRDIDAPTDVLSFPDEPVPGEAEPYLGDLILSLPYIQRQAEADAHALPDELVLAVIHGTLHLLGYDHDTPARQAEMWAKQAEALRVMAVDIVVPLFEFPDEDDSNRD
jgi:probable rRNA maturation factor